MNEINKDNVWDDFMSLGTEMDGPRFGPRVLKVNVPATIKFASSTQQGRYYGEWSTQHNKPHGRGIFVDEDGCVFIRYFFNGTTKVDGKVILFDGGFLGLGTGSIVNGSSYLLE